MSTTPQSAGKLRGLARLADADGRYRMIAVDQRPPLFAAIARARGVSEDQLTWQEVADAKTLLVRELAPHVGAVLLDPVWTHPNALLDLPRSTAMLSTLEGYDFTVVEGERRSEAIREWSVGKARRAGADAIKVLAWHRPDVSEATAAHQDAFVRAAAEACRVHDVPFVLELLDYPFPGEDASDPAWLAGKPERVLGSLRHYADPSFGVDLFKLELPFDVHRVREVAGGALDGVAREPLWTQEEADALLREVDAISPVPWLLLSAGVGPRAFTYALERAVAAGASGFLAGRAVWLTALDGWPDQDAVAGTLQRDSVPLLHQLGAVCEHATPWFAHRRYGGSPVLEHAGPDWSKRYLDVESAS